MAENMEASQKQIAKEGKYLTFYLMEQLYAVEILKVKEIIGLLPITTIPGLMEYMKGIINLRGKIIPIIDLRSKFAMKSEDCETTCIIVIETAQNGANFQMGIIVDSVSEVVNIKSVDIEETPNFGVKINTEFILGVAKLSDKVIILLNIDKVVISEDINIILE